MCSCDFFVQTELIDFVFSKAYPLAGKERIDKVEKLVCGLCSAYTHGWNGIKKSMMIFEFREVRSLVDIWMKTQFNLKSLT
jgi:hypothetical protein